MAKEATILVINQIRGDEVCCEPGNLKLIESLQDEVFFDLPMDLMGIDKGFRTVYAKIA